MFASVSNFLRRPVVQSAGLLVGAQGIALLGSKLSPALTVACTAVNGLFLKEIMQGERAPEPGAARVIMGAGAICAGVFGRYELAWAIMVLVASNTLTVLAAKRALDFERVQLIPGVFLSGTDYLR